MTNIDLKTQDLSNITYQTGLVCYAILPNTTPTRRIGIYCEFEDFQI